MKTKVLDFNATQPRRRFNLGNQRTIPHSPRRLILATIRLNTGPRKDVDDNKVELIATVGVRGVTGIAQVRFRIFRDGRQIFTAQQGVESAGSEQNYVIAFQAIDSSVSGVHVYTLTVENRTPGTRANVVGPLNFSGLAVRRTE